MALSRQYDAIFAKYAGRLPINYMRALSKRESDLNPLSGQSGSGAAGLMQVVSCVRTSYNDRHGTNYSRSDLFDPDTNVKIASDLLNRIVVAFGKHPDTNMRENWHNPEFVKLVTAGWNSGYSEAAGVGKVASYLENRGIPVTHDNVFDYASSAGGTVHLQNDSKRNWQRSVANLFYEEGGPGSVLLNLAVAVLIGWGLYIILR